MNITVIIPVKNGAATLHQCLQALRQQTGVTLQLLVLDSASTDNSKQIATDFGATIIDIEPSSFNHGVTRNVGVQYAQYPLVFFTVQDAFIANNDMLYKMASHFNDVKVMGVVGHQAVPHHADKNPYLWYRPISSATVTHRYIENEALLDSKPIAEQQATIAWDNVVAMYRLTAVQQQPFAITQYAEDWVWSNHALRRQWTLVYDTSLLVYHYHHQNFKYAFTSHYIIQQHLFLFFGYKPQLPALLMPLARVIYFFLKQPSLTLHQKWYWTVNNMARITGTYWAALYMKYQFFIKGTKGVQMFWQQHPLTVPQGQQKQ